MALVGEAFLTAVSKEWFLEPVLALAKTIPEPYAAFANAFAANLGAVIEVACLPLTFASNRSHSLRLQQLHMAERIRRIPIVTGASSSKEDKGLTPEQEREAYEKAQEALAKELASEETLRHLALQSFGYLAASLRDDDSRVAALELLRQSAVLTWGSFEVLSRDLFAALLNNHPSLVPRLASHPSTKARFSLRSIDVSEIAARGFDLTRSMGDLLLSVTDLSDLGLIKDSYAVLLPEANAVRELLAEKDLWVLFQRRHLIVHQRGVIDQQYLTKTGDAAATGTPLCVRPADLRRYLTLVRDAGVALLTGVAQL